MTLTNGHLPRGMADYFWQDASERRQLEFTLLDTFRRWGYNDIISPTLEFAETLRVLFDEASQSRIYRFPDYDGNTLALRYDMTVAIARLMGTRLHDAPMPQRFCYVGNVFRHTEAQGGQQREFWQAGVELIGADSAEADAEVLALTAKSLRRSGLSDFRMVVGQMRYFSGLLQELALSPQHQEMLHQAVMRKSEPQLEDFLHAVSLTTQQRHTVEQLFDLHGSDPLAVIDRAESLALNREMRLALRNLRAVYAVLVSYDVAHHYHLDLTEIRDLGYYTGMTFQAFTLEQGFSIAGGGRYDNLVGTFGPAMPAVGVAIGMDRLLLARRRQTGNRNHLHLPKLHCMVSAANSQRCYEIVQAWRNRGVRIAMDLDGLTGPALWQRARKEEIPRALAWTGAGFDVYDDPQQPDAPTRFVAEDDADGLFAELVTGGDVINSE